MCKAIEQRCPKCGAIMQANTIGWKCLFCATIIGVRGVYMHREEEPIPESKTIIKRKRWIVWRKSDGAIMCTLTSGKAGFLKSAAVKNERICTFMSEKFAYCGARSAGVSEDEAIAECVTETITREVCV